MLNIRLTPPTTTGPVKTEVTSVRDLPTEDLDTCTDCGGDLDTLTGNNGEIRAVFCPYCDE
ncbi:hypothetical protein [Streptomyces canus]|uniref:hypothetical protein n=1 Tax=Streptomyces canus TaxID=58343 RepID=UPI002781193C|nr:hypothetical protein [Streptomyces canus]MDQ0762017.1 hypothetical protein [Streptomyces canus]